MAADGRDLRVAAPGTREPDDGRMPQRLELTVPEPSRIHDSLEIPEKLNAPVSLSFHGGNDQPLDANEPLFQQPRGIEGHNFLRLVLGKPEAAFLIVAAILQAQDVPLALTSIRSNQNSRPDIPHPQIIRGLDRRGNLRIRPDMHPRDWLFHAHGQSRIGSNLPQVDREAEQHAQEDVNLFFLRRLVVEFFKEPEQRRPADVFDVRVTGYL